MSHMRVPHITAFQRHASARGLCDYILTDMCLRLLLVLFRSADQHQKDEESAKADGEVKVEKDVELERSETNSKFLKVSKCVDRTCDVPRKGWETYT